MNTFTRQVTQLFTSMIDKTRFNQDSAMTHDEFCTALKNNQKDFSDMRLMVDFNQIDVSGLNFRNSDLSHCTNVKRANNLCQATWHNANLSGQDLSETDLRGINLSHCTLRSVNFYNCDLQGANLSDSDLKRSNLSWSDLKDTNLAMSDCSGTNFSWSDLKGVNLQTAHTKKANLTHARYVKSETRFMDLSRKV